MQVKQIDNGWQVISPRFRFDISIEADLIEEVGRIYGYDQLPSAPGQGQLSMSPQPEGCITLNSLHELLIHRDYQEVVTYSFVDPQLQRTGIAAIATRHRHRDHSQAEHLVELIRADFVPPAVMLLVDSLENRVADDAVELERHFLGIRNPFADLLALGDLGLFQEVLELLVIGPGFRSIQRAGRRLSLGRLRHPVSAPFQGALRFAAPSGGSAADGSTTG